MKSILLVTVFLALPYTVFAQATAWDLELERRRAPKEKEIAMTYALAIVAGGACIGVGLYFGLRHSRKDKQ